ncbi:hypothetical protein [Pontibacillus marinus]|uniref:Uncharacterized protein n=1 Tax=Pontibacillus marinus BH030004 = DSM 16465 TaxID=1385511 RepID=A0A0A5G2Z3_9BACI|nr:hypothetical protein [Pontibacillus marinus]KGX86419.1 hypothetical protein N783_12275 [Pontibacillus marinus BH030004 = DSM 16465]
MGKKIYWIIIFITLAVNVVALQWTIESFFGEEYEHVITYSIVSIVSSLICVLTFWRWRKQEYK